ncbi:MAG: serpin family protein [Candidatus Alcyoniella australis]|nr:serpin family protein [Candidatus Alcyoniella australis]
MRVPRLKTALAAALLCSVLFASLAASAQSPTLLDQRKAADALNAFGLDLARKILADQPLQNALISPYSISSALLMTYNGADGATKEQMAAVLHLEAATLDQINAEQQALMNTLQGADPEVTMNIANSLWARQGLEFDRGFVGRNTEFFKAEVRVLDFLSPSAASTINAWVKQSTNGKIAGIVDKVPPDAVLYLINAIYFYGQWAEPFKPERTSDQPFKMPGGAIKQAPLMSRHGDFPYYENEQFQAVALHYGESEFSMLLLLPKDEDGLAALQQQLTAENWQSWRGRLCTREGSVQVPRFKLEYDNELSDELKALGMPVAFDKRQADFMAMLANPDPANNLYISRVKHKTFVEVNEKGTEAAAVTSVEISMTSAVPDRPRPFVFRADHPFLFAIQHNATGALLFLGSIVEPQE